MVWGIGSPDSLLGVWGMNPGVQEDAVGIPFVGPAGRELDNILGSKYVRLARNNVYISNLVKCFTPNNRDPNKSEISNCERWMRVELSRMPNPGVT